MIIRRYLFNVVSMETDDKEYYEYNNKRSLYQPLLFDFDTDEELEIDITEDDEQAELENINEAEF